MQIDFLTEENKQLSAKLETALSKLETVCPNDPIYGFMTYTTIFFRVLLLQSFF
jgi:hypothetical protein